ncbi:MAG: hypothetical protein KBT01_07680 [Clostridiales bacterium]|nr:hypothetical protein [Candidatus Blautia equi]
MYTLKNDRLTVTIAEPNKENRTCRFDRAGFITGVKLDGKYDFLAEEDMKDGSPSSGGMGLCCEIQADPMSEAAAIGEQFPKFGVGKLTKTKEGAYFFMDNYPCEDYEISVTEKEGSLVFTTAPSEIGGYAAAQEKIITIKDNTLTITSVLKNAGSKDIAFDEYCHNFMTLNHKKVNQDYSLEIPCVEMPEGEIKTVEAATTFRSTGRSLSKTDVSMVFALYAFGKDQMKPVSSYGWTLTDKAEGLRVSESDDFTVDKVTVWSVGDAISPEMFFSAVLKPGEETRWSRTYTFEKL